MFPVSLGAKPVKSRASQASSAQQKGHKPLKDNGLHHNQKARVAPPDPDGPAKQQQLKHYEEALTLFQQQKFQRAKQSLERVIEGPSKELGERAQVHLRVCDQRISRAPAPVLKSAEDHYTQGVALMNLGRWDDAREHLDRARKTAPKADHIVYAMAVLDCLTGEADSAMDNLKIAIQLRPENRYHARNDEDFAFLQEDPRFTELLYPERDGSGG
jgi:tetratricopeptide (TPR) repeat protein